MTSSTGKDLRYAIIGAGMAGLLAGVKLRASGQTNFTIYEKGDSVGGTWRENRYPGLTCDVPAHAYTYSFAPYAEWDAFYATGQQIKSYFEQVAQDFNLMPHIQFGCEVKSCCFDDATNKWRLGLSPDHTDEVDIVIAASGVLHEPKLPEIEGLESFRGHSFHSARWDDNAVLDNTRIGVIGNGSTGVQITSALSDRAQKLIHFQRSPQWIMPVMQFPYSDADKARFRQDTAAIDAIRDDPEYWANVHRFNRAINDPDGAEMDMIEGYCRHYLETSITDPLLREKLRPNYRAACKRLIYSWNYYDCVQRPAVTIETGAIKRVVGDGIEMSDGTRHTLDVLVLATGFRADRFIRPTLVTGRNSRSLDDFWARRATAHYAISMPDFPNFFMLNGPTGPVGNFSLIDIAEKQWAYIAQLLEPLRTGLAATVEPSQGAFEDYEQRRIEAAQKTVFASGCTSWYLDQENIPMTWPWSYDHFTTSMATPIWSEYETR